MFQGRGNAICDNCGAVHRMVDRHVPYNDPDSVNCLRCGHELYRWDGSVEWRAELIETPGVPSVTRSAPVEGALADRQEKHDGASLKAIFDTASKDVTAGSRPVAADLLRNGPRR